MVQKIDATFRASTQYQEWMAGIKAMRPDLPDQLAEMAIMAHLGDPQAYRKAKKRGYVPPPPRPMPEGPVIKNVIVENPPEEEKQEEECSCTLEAHPLSDCTSTLTCE